MSVDKIKKKKVQEWPYKLMYFCKVISEFVIIVVIDLKIIETFEELPKAFSYF